MDPELRRQALERVQAVAQRQHQIVRTCDLAGSGLTRPVIDGLVASGWLRRLHKGVYLVGPAEPSGWQRTVAAWMAVGAPAVVSHSSAAAAHRVPHLIAGDVPELTVTGSRHPRPDGVVVHRARALGPADSEPRGGIPVTTPARTLIDMAPRLPPGLLAKVMDEGAIERLWTPESLLAARRRAGRRPGLIALDRLLEERAGTSRADSHLESRVERALRSVGPFRAHHQVVLDGRVVVTDLALPELRLAVETDGWATRRRSRGKFDGDRRRGNLLIAHGWTVVHLTSAMSDDEMRRAVVDVMVRLAAAVGRRPHGSVT